MFPDLFNAKVNGKTRGRAGRRVDWYENEFMPRVGKRGAEIIEARGASSAAVGRQRRGRPRARLGAGRPTACARWACWTSGQYGIEEGLDLLAARAAARAATTRVEEGLEIGDFAQAKIDITVNELKEEREAVRKLGLVG